MRRVLLMFAASVLVAGTGASQVPMITTVAGNGSDGFCGDGGPATSACVATPTGVAVDAAGNVFIAEHWADHRIRKVDTAGRVTTVAGNGTAGFCGDGGPATSACLAHPPAVAVDAAGNLFIADNNNHRIRRVNAAGTITTVAGNGTAGFCGDGGPATSACLSHPYGVAVNAAGELFIAEYGNHRIRKVDAAGRITTVAGNGTETFCGDGGPATHACLSSPTGVAVDVTGNLTITDYRNHRIRKVDTAGTIRTVAGNGTAGFCGDGGPATSACLNLPFATVEDAAGNLFIGDTWNERIRMVDPTGTITTVAGNGSDAYCGDGGPAISACLGNPHGVALDSAGSLFIAEYHNHRIRKVTGLSDGLALLRLTHPILAGCLTTTGKVTLRAPAPVGGLTVALHSDNPKVVVPASLIFKVGVLAKAFPILTSSVAARETATIEASVPDGVASAVLTLTPMGVRSVSLTPNSVVGGNVVAGTVTLPCPAGPGDIEVALTSTKAFIAEPTTDTILIPLGTQSFPFEVRTTPVFAPVSLAIKATANEVTKARKLALEPAP